MLLSILPWGCTVSINSWPTPYGGCTVRIWLAHSYVHRKTHLAHFTQRKLWTAIHAGVISGTKHQWRYRGHQKINHYVQSLYWIMSFCCTTPFWTLVAAVAAASSVGMLEVAWGWLWVVPSALRGMPLQIFWRVLGFWIRTGLWCSLFQNACQAVN